MGMYPIGTFYRYLLVYKHFVTITADMSRIQLNRSNQRSFSVSAALALEMYFFASIKASRSTFPK